MYTASTDASTSIKPRNKTIELNAWALIIINNLNKKKKLKFLGAGHNNKSIQINKMSWVKKKNCHDKFAVNKI